MRATVETRQINGFECTLVLDTGGPVGSDHLMIVRKEQTDFLLNRWFYFDEQVEGYMWNFANKVCTDEEYRSKSVSGDADWKRVSNLYEPLAGRLYDVLARSEQTRFPVIDKDSRSHSNELESQCETVFEEIRSVVRDGVDKHPDRIFEDAKSDLKSNI